MPIAQQIFHVFGVDFETAEIPSIALSHPFRERPMNTVRCEYLVPVLFWNAIDLARKRDKF